MDPLYPLTPIANFLACILVLFPLLCTSVCSGSWNIAVTVFALWSAVDSIITGIDAIIWSDNVRDAAPVWCDITTRLDFASRIALRACTFVLTRSLYNIALCERNSTRIIRNKVIYDLIWTVGLPSISMLLYYVVQENRFVIIEEEGCIIWGSTSGLQILLFDVPTVILPAISALVYCPRTLWVIYNQRKGLKGNSPSDPSFSGELYLRVMALGCVDAVLTLPLSIFSLVIDLSPFPPTSFYSGWRKVHAKFSNIPVFPANEWKKDIWLTIRVNYNLWINPFTAFSFFAVFGLTKEARAVYRRMFWKVMSFLGLKDHQSDGPVFSNIGFNSASHKTTLATFRLPTSSGVVDLPYSEAGGHAIEFSMSPATEEETVAFDGEFSGGETMESSVQRQNSI